MKDKLSNLQLSWPEPTPMPSLEYYRKERELCLSLDEQKNTNYQKFIARNPDSFEVDFLPTILDIEPVSRCNLSCTMCQVSSWTKSQRARDMTFSEFKDLIDSQYGLVEIKLHGYGEVLMNAEVFFKMVSYARSKHIWVRTVTNGTQLHLKDNYKKIIDSDINEIQISIDGAVVSPVNPTFLKCCFLPVLDSL